MRRRILTFAVTAAFLLYGALAAGAILWAAESNGAATEHDFAPVRQRLIEAVEEQQIAGAVALVIDHGKVVYDEAVGWRNVAEQAPMTRDTIFRIASMTKPVTSVAVMMLYEDCKLELDDPVAKYLPEFADMQVASGEEKVRVARVARARQGGCQSADGQRQL